MPSPETELQETQCDGCPDPTDLCEQCFDRENYAWSPPWEYRPQFNGTTWDVMDGFKKQGGSEFTGTIEECKAWIQGYEQGCDDNR